MDACECVWSLRQLWYVMVAVGEKSQEGGERRLAYVFFRAAEEGCGALMVRQSVPDPHSQ